LEVSIRVNSSSMSDANDNKQGGAEIPENAQDLTIFVQNLLEQMVTKVKSTRQHLVSGV
jgi:hypothetical protein